VVYRLGRVYRFSQASVRSFPGLRRALTAQDLAACAAGPPRTRLSGLRIQSLPGPCPQHSRQFTYWLGDRMAPLGASAAGCGDLGFAIAQRRVMGGSTHTRASEESLMRRLCFRPSPRRVRSRLEGRCSERGVLILQPAVLRSRHYSTGGATCVCLSNIGANILVERDETLTARVCAARLSGAV
jgi:hypothetical protein